MTRIYLKVDHSDVVFSSNIESFLLFAISVLLNSGKLSSILTRDSHCFNLLDSLQKFQEIFCESLL